VPKRSLPQNGNLIPARTISIWRSTFIRIASAIGSGILRIRAQLFYVIRVTWRTLRTG
jgi:hypothetical protein